MEATPNFLFAGEAEQLQDIQQRLQKTALGINSAMLTNTIRIVSDNLYTCYALLQLAEGINAHLPELQKEAVERAVAEGRVIQGPPKDA